MKNSKVAGFIEEVLAHMPADWLNLTTHRLDIYDEQRAKSQFIEEFEALYQLGTATEAALSKLPTAYDYIRLGHALSSVLEWTVARELELNAAGVISFQSSTVPILAVLRKNLLSGQTTRLVYTDALPARFNAEVVRRVYGYNFELVQLENLANLRPAEGSTVVVSSANPAGKLTSAIDFYVHQLGELGSIMLINGERNAGYVSEIQHVRRRETIAMTPANCLVVLNQLLGKSSSEKITTDSAANRASVEQLIREITATSSKPLIGSSGLSVQYAIMMGLVDSAQQEHPGKPIKFIVPPNCYGGTNDQARRVAACLSQVEILDLPVDGSNDMVSSVDRVLAQVAGQDAVPYIIAEIPTNPRVEVPDLPKLREALSKQRITPQGSPAVAPVFILDQTFCPNVQFLGPEGILNSVKAIAYVSGSKFPSGGKATAGYCVANQAASALLPKIEQHLTLCNNQATELQLAILAEQMPSMNQRIAAAYRNTRDFVNFVEKTLPAAKINFVSEELADQGFTPSVFSLDLPTKGKTEAERENYKRAQNLKLITMMIEEIPEESKYCVSYGQLKGCYWTIPATSTQGTTKEGDKDYIVRVSLSPNMDMERHKEVFRKFMAGI